MKIRGVVLKSEKTGINRAMFIVEQTDVIITYLFTIYIFWEAISNLNILASHGGLATVRSKA
jgi:hypothetical protein